MSYQFLSPTFNIGNINIGNIEGASCFSVGNNFVSDFKSYKKHNQGFGNIHGDKNLFPNSGSILKDSSSSYILREKGQKPKEAEQTQQEQQD